MTMPVQFWGTKVMFTSANKVAMAPACCCVTCPLPDCTVCVPWEFHRPVDEYFDINQHVIGFNPSAWSVTGVIATYLDAATCTCLTEHIQGTVFTMWNGADVPEISIKVSTYQRAGQTTQQGLCNPGWKVRAEITLRDGVGTVAPGACGYMIFEATVEPVSLPTCINFSVGYDLTNENDPDNSDPEMYLAIGDEYQKQTIDACTGYHIRPPNTDPWTRIGNSSLVSDQFNGMLMDLTVWDFRYMSIDHRDDWDDLVAGLYPSGRCSHPGGFARYNWCDARINWKQDQTDNCTSSLVLRYNGPG